MVAMKFKITRSSNTTYSLAYRRWFCWYFVRRNGVQAYFDTVFDAFEYARNIFGVKEKLEVGTSNPSDVVCKFKIYE
jgi:hypothetical protein